jgi:hypothetical protein
MRMAYGHSGTRLQRIVVTGSLPVSAPTPLWLKLVLLATWIIVVALVSRYALPKTSLPMKTVIDISKLSVKPPPAMVKPIRPKPEQVLPTEPPPKTLPDKAPEPLIRKPLERQTIAPQIVEVNRPAISRPHPSQSPDFVENRTHVTRERRPVDAENTPTLTVRPRREAMTVEAPSEKTNISRARGVTVMDAPDAKDRIVVRRAPSGDLPVATSGSTQRPVMRNERSVTPVVETAPRAAASRERTHIAGGVEGESTAAIGLARGVSLQSLEICSSPQLQEEGIRAILRVVGSRLSCTDEKGEFQFKGTKRISSFNLLIFPSPGRKPSNRCEELENAYKCLKTH